MTVFYTLKDLSEALLLEGLPASRMYINQLEREGIIKKPTSSVHFRVKDASKIAKSEMRIYSEKDIRSIINIVRKHKKSITDGRKKG